MFRETVTLSNGVVVPQLALGTWLIDDDKAADAIRAAVSSFPPVFGGKLKGYSGKPGSEVI